ncbi:hypothetical protein [Streptomyces lunalinharesii]|uniref:hypothetical protein n=1 Tax=Streptomyces lunalinharesii TaxID=333384 RepID=UPI0031DEE12F
MIDQTDLRAGRAEGADALLVRDSWDDFGYRTLFTLFLVVDGEAIAAGCAATASLRADGIPVDVPALSGELAGHFTTGTGESSEVE